MKNVTEYPKIDWADFVKNHWEKKPVHFRNIFSPSFLTSNEAFDLTIKSSEAYRGNGMPRTAINVSKSGDSGRANVSHLLPIKEDKNFLHFAKRLNEEFALPEFILYASNIHIYNFELWSKLRLFLANLFDLVGVPSAKVGTEIYGGSYRATPHGVHTDPLSNFMFVMEGKKRMVFWSSETWKQIGLPMNTRDYKIARDRATIFEGNAGDLIYWPSGYFHVAENDDLSPSMTFHINLWLPAEKNKERDALGVEFEPIELLFRVLKAAVKPSLQQMQFQKSYPFQSKNTQETANKPPAEIHSTAEIIRKFVSSPQYLEKIVSAWVQHVSAYGFIEVPSKLENVPTLDAKTTISGNVGFPILWTVLGERIVFVCNGHALACESNPSLIRFFEMLNQGETFLVESVFDRFCNESTGGELDEDEFRTLLEQLLKMRALVTV